VTSELTRLKAIVTHLVDDWSSVLRQRQYLQTIGNNEALVDALENTYAAHVHNTVGVVFVVDLIRCVGALITDTRKGTASLAKAIELLGKDVILRSLLSESAKVESGRFVSEAAAKALENAFLAQGPGHIREAKVALESIDREVLHSALADKLQKMRHMAIAHHAIIFESGNWRLWRTQAPVLTYGELDTFIDMCTQAIDRVAHLVLRRSHAFAAEPLNAQLHAEQYVEALLVGLQQQRQQRSTLLARLNSPRDPPP
jgi:hypothetical protein